MPANVMMHKMCNPGGEPMSNPVVIHRPRCRREQPLEGLKPLKQPAASPEFQQVMAQRALELVNPRDERIGRVLGWSSLGMALVCLVELLLCLCGVELPRVLELMTVLWVVGLHLGAIFSQMLSSRRNLPGALAIPVLYLGFAALHLGDWLVREWIL